MSCAAAVGQIYLFTLGDFWGCVQFLDSLIEMSGPVKSSSVYNTKRFLRCQHMQSKMLFSCALLASVSSQTEATLHSLLIVCFSFHLHDKRLKTFETFVKRCRLVLPFRGSSPKIFFDPTCTTNLKLDVVCVCMPVIAEKCLITIPAELTDASPGSNKRKYSQITGIVQNV